MWIMLMSEALWLVSLGNGNSSDRADRRKYRTREGSGKMTGGTENNCIFFIVGILFNFQVKKALVVLGAYACIFRTRTPVRKYLA